MKKTILFLPIFFTTIIIVAQQQNSVWFFGQNAGIDFSVIPPMAISGQVETGEGSAAIANSNGELLFYTSGTDMWDRNHTLMPNGTGLMGGNSSTQAALIVPLPESNRYFYVFTTEDHEENGDLAYSIVDMCLRDGLGDIIPESKNTILHTQSAEKLTAVLHANKRDVWIITHELRTNHFRTYLLTPSGLDPNPIISAVGAVHNGMAGIGPIKPSHKGDKLVCAATFFGICEMFDFDKTSGVVSNPVDLNQIYDGLDFAYGIEFSPDDRFLYISTTFVSCELYQIHLEQESIITLGAINGNYHYGALQLAPNGKIYLARAPQPFIGVIHQPNEPGVNCQYEPEGFDLADGTTSSLGLPSFIPFGVEVRHGVETEISVSICQGEQWEGYTESGIYTDTFTVDEVCDSIRVLRLYVNKCAPLLHYTLDDCTAYAHLGTNMDYSEFMPEYVENPDCAEIEASILDRDHPAENKHSCTPGLNNSPAMCFSSHASCTYEAGHTSSLFFIIDISIDPDQAFHLTGFSFHEKAPSVYTWIDGPSGPNNYPTQYGLRILKDDVEIFRSHDLPTSPDWQEHHFSFLSDTQFLVHGNTRFRFELLPYCPIGNGAEVSAWDIEDLRVFGGCADQSGDDVTIAGSVTRSGMEKLPGVFVLATPHAEEHFIAVGSSNSDGDYVIPGLYQGETYVLEAVRYAPVLEGVNVLDLLMIQRHILGSLMLTDVPRLIAADIYPDKEITILDMLQLRKVLLGLHSYFPDNTSWRIGRFQHENDPNPFNQFEESVQMDSMKTSVRGVDWIGVKVGDVNGSLSLSSSGHPLSYRENDRMEMRVGIQDSDLRDQHIINIISPVHVAFEGMQLGLLIPDAEILNVSSKVMSFTQDDYFQSGDTLRLIAMASDQFEVTAEDTFLRITLRPRNQRVLDVTHPIRMLDGGYNLFVKNNQEVPIALFGSSLRMDEAEGMDMHIHPNPNYGRFNIEITSPVSDSGRIQLVTPDGKMLSETHCILTPGLNRFQLDFSSRGIQKQLAYCRFISNTHQLSRTVFMN